MPQLTYIDIIHIALVATLCGLMLFSKDVIKVIASFMGVLMLVAMIFLLSNFGFLFITQLLLYIGGISVLLVFVIMLTKRLTKEKNLVSQSKNWIFGILVGSGLVAVFIFALNKSYAPGRIFQFNEVRAFGVGIVSSYLFAFELLAIFLLIALILAAVIAGKKTDI